MLPARNQCRASGCEMGTVHVYSKILVTRKLLSFKSTITQIQFCERKRKQEKIEAKYNFNRGKEAENLLFQSSHFFGFFVLILTQKKRNVEYYFSA